MLVCICVVSKGGTWRCVTCSVVWIHSQVRNIAFISIEGIGHNFEKGRKERKREMKKVFYSLAILLLVFAVAMAQDFFDTSDDLFDPDVVRFGIPASAPASPDTSVTGTLDKSKFPIIEMYVDVRDDQGMPIPGLTESDFCVSQDGVPVSFQVTEVGQQGCPTSVSLVIDASGSMYGTPIADAREAARQFVRNMDVFDEVAIIPFGQFDDCVDSNHAFSNDTTVLMAEIAGIEAVGMTPLHDGIWVGVDLVAQQLGSKAVIAFSDGIENWSDECWPPPTSSMPGDSIIICDKANAAGSPIFTIGIGNVTPANLMSFAWGTGGYYQYAPSASDMDSLYSVIKETLCSRYFITFTSPDTIQDGDTHEVVVCEGGQSCWPCDTLYYTEDCSPVIAVDPTTDSLGYDCQLPDEDMMICAYVTDNCEPFLEGVTLYWRHSDPNPTSYSSMPMSNSGGDLFCAVIPDSSIPIGTSAIDYYVVATDGVATTSYPADNPQLYPISVSICPNDLPFIDHTMPMANCDEDLLISATVIDTFHFVDHAMLYYRKTGDILYDNTPMAPGTTPNTWEGTIPASYVVETGVDYIIRAWDDFGAMSEIGPLTLFCGSPGCYPDLPPPVLIVEECAEQTLSSTRFFLDVLNWDVYPDELFEPAPDLPPCGDNPNSARSWVDIFDQDGNYIYGFCALGQSSDMNNMWFSIQGGIWPDSVYITITDRRCDIVYTSNMAPIENIMFPPTIVCPEDTFVVTLQNPDDVCVPLPIAGDVTVTAGDATWDNGQLCFYADQSGMYMFQVHASNDCGDDYCDVYVDVTVGGINPTPEWINVFCYEPMLNGIPLNEGDVVRAYDPDGVLCGMDIVGADGTFGFMPVYRDDPYSPGIDEGADPGDVISFSINGEMVLTDPIVIWTSNGALVEVCSFSTCKQIHLNSGWNLISWNLNYIASIEDFLMEQFDGTDCLDVILSFDMGALTYDPLLPDFATLHTVDYHHGYWIRINCEWDIEICGQMIDPGEYIHVYNGWNLVSYWPMETMTVEDGFVSILDVLDVAIGFDNGGQVWLPGDPSMNTLTELRECFGYWAKVSEDRTLCYPGWCDGVPPPAKIDPNAVSFDVTPSRYWMSIYGKNLTLDGNNIENVAEIEIYSAEGLLCGTGVYENELLRFTPIYGHDALDNATTGYPRDGELVSLHVNGVRVYPDIVWSGHGNSARLDNLSTTKDGSMTPGSFRLAQNYPNPFNPTTVISFSLESPGRVDLAIYNLLGQSIRTLINANMQAGDHETVWDGTDDNGMPVSSGVYFYRLQAGSFSKTMKMMLMK